MVQGAGMAGNSTGETRAFKANNCPLAPVEPGITYPSYMSFDDFIDVDRLKSLDGFIAARLREHKQNGSIDFFINEHRLDREQPCQPGIREVWLSRTPPATPYNYLDLDHVELWQRTPEADEFQPLMEFIDSLPFSATGRMLIIYDDAGVSVPAHRDHVDTSVCNEFIWFRTNLEKPFYLLNAETGRKEYVSSYSAWFDSVNQHHGCDAVSGLTFSIRVDGVFTEDFKAAIPQPRVNKASTASLWACTLH